jgi:hypothetical protein
MSLAVRDEPKERRPIGWSLLGVVLAMGAGYLFYDALRTQSADAPLPTAYQYKITQGVKTDVNYFDSSFFSNGPEQNTAFVTELTKDVKAKFRLSYEGSDTAELRYSYFVRAEVRGDYAIKGTDNENPSVWKKSYELQKPVVKTETTNQFTIEPEVTIPFSTYKDTMAQFRTALSLPLNSQVSVACVLQVSGTVNDTPFTETKTAVVSAPLDQQIFTLAVKFDKETTKQVVSQSQKSEKNTGSSLRIIGAAVAAAAGLGMIVYGLRKRIFKTPYQRELDKIFRYHDGIIIRASRPADLEGKHMVPVKTFDDMLNLEEELKTPIVACPAGSEATQFVIVHGDVLYMYTLGRVFVDSESLHAVEASLDDVPLPTPNRRKATSKTSRRKIQ